VVLGTRLLATYFGEKDSILFLESAQVIWLICLCLLTLDLFRMYVRQGWVSASHSVKTGKNQNPVSFRKNDPEVIIIQYTVHLCISHVRTVWFLLLF